MTTYQYVDKYTQVALSYLVNIYQWTMMDERSALHNIEFSIVKGPVMTGHNQPGYNQYLGTDCKRPTRAIIKQL